MTDILELTKPFGVPQVAPPELPVNAAAWSYEEAFSRNAGLFTPQEQDKLRHSRVAIIGMGGVGGVHLMTLARMGIGAFTIADPDEFEVANFNRQYGARIDTIGRSKIEVMKEEALKINPELGIRTFDAHIDAGNVADFMQGADVLVDGVDFYAMQARRLAFATARANGLWGVTVGPHAFSASWLAFSPAGMSFDRYFDLSDDMDAADQIVAFAVGGTPSPIHLKYLNLATYFRPQSRAAASLGLACHLASGMMGTLVAKILLGRGEVKAAPWYGQFDAYRQKLVQRRLWFGNRHPWQRIKRNWLKQRMTRAPSVSGGASS